MLVTLILFFIILKKGVIVFLKLRQVEAMSSMRPCTRIVTRQLATVSCSIQSRQTERKQEPLKYSISYLPLRSIRGNYLNSPKAAVCGPVVLKLFYLKSKDKIFIKKQVTDVLAGEAILIIS